MRAIDRKLFRDLLPLRGQVIAIALVIARGSMSLAISPEYVYEIGGGEMFPDSCRFGVLSQDA